jgi:hypothetical protein
MCPLYRPAWTIAGIAALLMLVLATPAAAADQQEGWFAALDVALTQPNSLDHHYADQLDFSGPFPQTNRLVLENDDDTTFEVGIGYNFGGSLGSLKVSYWGYDNDQTESGFVPGFSTPAVFGSGYYTSFYSVYYGGGYIYGMTLYDADLTVQSDIKATTIDVDYVRPVNTGEKTTLNWLAGLRVATFEEDLGYAGDDGFVVYSQGRHLETDAAGFRVGVAADFNFTEHFGMVTGMAVSFMQADTEGISFQDFDGGAFETRTAEDDNVFGTIWDFDLKFLWTGGRLDYYLGYSVSVWDGLVTNPVPPNGLGFLPGVSAPRTRDSIGFNSVHGGVIWRFGGG